MHTTEPLVPGLCSFKDEIAVGKLKRIKSQNTDQILAEVIHTGGNMLHSDIQKLINSIWNKEELLQQWKESVIVPIYKKGTRTDCINYRGIFFTNNIQNILQYCLEVNPICR